MVVILTSIPILQKTAMIYRVATIPALKMIKGIMYKTRIMPIADHIPKEPNLLALGPNSDSGESEVIIIKEQNNRAEIVVVNIIPNSLNFLLI